MANLDKIRELCKQKNLSLNKLAEQVGISPNGLQRIIKDNSTKIDTLEKIAEILEVPVYKFFQEQTIDPKLHEEYKGRIEDFQKILMKHESMMNLYRDFVLMVEERFGNTKYSINPRDIEESMDKLLTYCNFLKMYDPFFSEPLREMEQIEKDFESKVTNYFGLKKK